MDPSRREGQPTTTAGPSPPATTESTTAGTWSTSSLLSSVKTVAMGLGASSLATQQQLIKQYEMNSDCLLPAVVRFFVQQQFRHVRFARLLLPLSS